MSSSLLTRIQVGLIIFLGLAEEPFIPSLPRESDPEVAAHRNRMHDEVYPWFFETGESSSFNGWKNVSISYRKWIVDDAKATRAVIFLHGASETMAKYAELVYDFRQLLPDYDLYIMDHRGMGTSGRLLQDTRKLHVDDFQYYIYDVKTFYDSIVAPNQYDKVFFWAHSLGASSFAEHKQFHHNKGQL